MQINPHAASQSEESGLLAQAIVCRRTFFPRPWLKRRLVAVATNGECQLRGVVTLEDSFRTPTPHGRSSQFDPSLPSASSISLPVSCLSGSQTDALLQAARLRDLRIPRDALALALQRYPHAATVRLHRP
jgi:hypothetical protein